MSPVRRLVGERCGPAARNYLHHLFQCFKAHGKAAPFRRNDGLLDAKPIGLIAFPGAGVSANLADKARARGIRVWQHGTPAPSARPAPAIETIEADEPVMADAWSLNQRPSYGNRAIYLRR